MGQDQADKRPEISLIIPYRADEKFVDTSINTAENQVCKGLEVITIEYGSKGGKGLYEALNEGLEKACGKYIAFLDAGDVLLSEQAVDKWTQIMEDYEEEGKPADILVLNHYLIDQNGDKELIAHGLSDSVEESDYKFRFEGFFSKGYLSDTTGKLFRRSFIEENELKFEDVPYGTRMLFSFCCHANEPVYIFSDDADYGKVIRQRVKEAVDEDAWLAIASLFERYLRTKGDHPEFLDICAYTAFFGIYTSVNDAFSASASKKEIYELFKRFHDNDKLMRYINWLANGKFIRKLNHRAYRTMVPPLAAMMVSGRYSLLITATKRLMKNDRIRRL